MRFLRSQENVHNLPTTLYVMKNALTHLNTIVPLITLIMCYLLQVLTYASVFLTTLKFDHSNINTVVLRLILTNSAWSGLFQIR